MTIEVKINDIIDSLICEFDEIEAYRRVVPRGPYEDSNPGQRALYECSERAIQKITVVAKALGVPSSVVWETVLTARRWYHRTEWEFCLSEDTAARLWKLAVSNNTKEFGGWA